MNFFKLYIGDYQRDTAHLSIAEHGAYMLMLQHYYATERPLPAGKALHRMLRAQDKTERDAIDSIAAQFWSTTDEGLVNQRADAEIGKASAQAITNARIAREREDKRKAQRTEHDQSTNRATNDQPNQTPDTIKEPPCTPRGGKRRPSGSKTFRAWIADMRAKPEKPIPEGDPVFAYCEQVGLPSEFLAYHWREFKAQYADSDKRYTDWRRVLRVSVRRNWFRLWFPDRDGNMALTTAGEQARRAFDAEHRGAA